MKLLVNRFSDDGKQTLSHISLIESGNLVNTFAGMELSWKENKKGISCIPVGTYKCVKRDKTNAIPYQHVLIKYVPNRSGICIHRANYSRQLRGCIAVGLKHIDIDNDNLIDITNSGKAFNILMTLLPNEFEIEIK